MERGSNLNVPEFCKGTLSHYAVCNNNSTQYTELWVQLGTTVNYQGLSNMTQFPLSVVTECFLIYFIICILRN
jgi:hypothetical protein